MELLSHCCTKTLSVLDEQACRSLALCSSFRHHSCTQHHLQQLIAHVLRAFLAPLLPNQWGSARVTQA